MNFLQHASNPFSSLKKWWQGSNDQTEKTEKTPSVPDKTTTSGPQDDSYYVDTIAKADQDSAILPAHFRPGKLEKHFEEVNARINTSEPRNHINFERELALMFQIIMMQMRMDHKVDSYYMHKFSVEGKNTVGAIQKTYNTAATIGLTVLTTALHLGAAGAGFAPFVFSAASMTAAKADQLSKASAAISGLATGTGGFGSLVGNSSEAKRQGLQSEKQRIEQGEGEHKDSRQTKQQLLNNAKSAVDQAQNAAHEANKAASAA